MEGSLYLWGKVKDGLSLASGGRLFGEQYTMSRYVSHAAAGFQTIA